MKLPSVLRDEAAEARDRVEDLNQASYWSGRANALSEMITRLKSAGVWLVNTCGDRGRRFPLFLGLRPFDKARLGPDLVAGVTLVAMNIPQAMGYTKIAGTPVVTGLHTLLLPVAAFAVFGASRYLASRGRRFGDSRNPRRGRVTTGGARRG